MGETTGKNLCTSKNCSYIL